MVRFEFGLCSRARAEKIMDLLVEAVSKNKCIGKCEPMWLHRMEFLR